ncbi:helix-turn-helix transcriptional regulator [Paenibacillus sp. SYP-B4298]|uniref:helix-turn-helix transcriptional regulator n=1 Tax=Paenibacillus sp. SYP-B4298 TaxID=2996034 RepID=UPI0022DD697B|nr:helix-turn-helix domain-containing protein [Paenibacillus sp. SYP-B4298]
MDIRLLDHIFPQFTYVADRKCSVNWKFQGDMIYDKHNLILVYDGEAELTCNDQVFNVSRGDLVYFKPQDYRLGHTFPDRLMHCYTVDFLYTCPVMKEHGWELVDAALPFQPVEKINDPYLFSRLNDLFSSFTRTWLSGNHNKATRGRAIFMEMLTLLLQWKAGANFNYDKVRKVEKAINFMTQSFQSRITLQEIADHVGISPSYLGGIFKEMIGTSPITYLLGIRLRKAKELLKDGYSVTETAEQVGFNDIFYFSKSFKRFEGMTPSQYIVEGS